MSEISHHGNAPGITDHGSTNYTVSVCRQTNRSPGVGALHPPLYGCVQPSHLFRQHAFPVHKCWKGSVVTFHCSLDVWAICHRHDRNVNIQFLTILAIAGKGKVEVNV